MKAYFEVNVVWILFCLIVSFHRYIASDFCIDKYSFTILGLLQLIWIYKKNVLIGSLIFWNAGVGLWQKRKHCGMLQ